MKQGLASGLTEKALGDGRQLSKSQLQTVVHRSSQRAVQGLLEIPDSLYLAAGAHQSAA